MQVGINKEVDGTREDEGEEEGAVVAVASDLQACSRLSDHYLTLLLLALPRNKKSMSSRIRAPLAKKRRRETRKVLPGPRMISRFEELRLGEDCEYIRALLSAIRHPDDKNMRLTLNYTSNCG